VAQRIIEDEGDVRKGLDHLTRKCALMREAHRIAGAPPHRRSVGGFEGLARIIVAQQLSVASADAIWDRLGRAVRPFEAGLFLKKREKTLRAAGLSGAKVRTLRGVATAIVAGDLEMAGLDSASDDEVLETLTALKGIGPWTADIYLMFALGRADAFAAGDLALQNAAGMLLESTERPGPGELLELAETWRPWRGVAARLLWAYYREIKQINTGAPV